MKGWTFMLPLAALALAGCQKTPEAPAPIRPVLSIAVEPQSQAGPSFVGTVEPRVTAAMAFRLGGTLVNRNVDVGASVKAGDVLASLESTTLGLAVKSAEASLANAQAQFQNAQAAESRYSALAQSDTISQANLEQARQQRQAAQAGVVQAQSGLAQANDQLGYAQLIAGFDGIVTAVGAESGQVVTPGEAVVTLAQPDARDVVIDVPDAFAQSVAIGAEFTVALQLAPQITATGTLHEIAPQADAVTRLRRLRIGLEQPPASFWLGTTAVASAPTAAADQIALPASAVNMTGGVASVWIVDEAGGTVASRPVEAGAPVGGLVPILSGLKPGERVVTAGVHSLAEGQRVRFDTGALP
ncbi:MAG: efflux transporter, family, subunit [Devosia sp.]|uniref:efflux RND transporter periplasmic adaptor subunit n=1 Tax=Devosia sp. TaxID=1871048 RepID=UPI00262A5D46|nr:efflux RND transporter periplasmic adaptor subunit [Devosia sp.]MDB5528408.1 efflux transporter, family, subunit [Devosia sp.]